MTSDQGQPNPYSPQPGVPPTPPPPYPPPGMVPPLPGYAQLPPNGYVAQGYAPQGYVPQGYAPPPPGYAPMPPGYPSAVPGQPQQVGYYTPYQMMPGDDPETMARKAKAKKYVRISAWLGWGGLIFLFIMPCVLGGVLRSEVAAVGAGFLGFAAAITGAVIGQIGRGMQGRVM